MSEPAKKSSPNYKYVYVEMIREERGKYDVVTGLFKGLLKRGEDVYILLSGIDNVVNMLNTNFYSIMTIEYLSGKAGVNGTVSTDMRRYLTVFTHEKGDQEKASALITSIFEDLLEMGFGTKGETSIIDETKYSDVPKDYLKGKTTTAPVSNNKSVTGKTHAPVQRFQRGATEYAAYSNIPVKRDPEPTFFKRTRGQRKLTKDQMGELIDKLDAILAGNFEPDLPDTSKIDGPVTDDDDDFDVYDYRYHNGMY